MKKYNSSELRNVAVIGHGGSGKTSLVEAMLFATGATKRLGKVEEGNTVTDYDPEEIKRKISINASLAPCEWDNHKINIMDTPGYFDFVGEVISALRVADGALVVVDAASGVEVGTEKVMAHADEDHLPCLAMVNRMDRENANFQKAYQGLRETFGNRVVPIHLPIGSAENFKGIVDLVKMRALLFEAGGKSHEEEIPSPLTAEAQEMREVLAEAVAANDDDLMMKYLEGEPLTQAEVERGLAKGVADGQVIPVLCGSAAKGLGILQLLDAIVATIPAPTTLPPARGINPKTREESSRNIDPKEPLSVFVFKTMADPYVGKLTLFKVYSGVLRSDSHVYNATRDKEERLGQLFIPHGKEQEAVPEIVAGDIGAVAKLQETGTGNTLCDKEKPVVFPNIDFPKPVLTMAVEPKTKGDEDKIGSGLARLSEEDPTFRVEKNTETGQTLISGLGELHLEIITSRLRKKFGVDVEIANPRIPFKETIRGTVKVEGKHKKQSGGRGQYGHVWLELSPLPPGGNFEFVDKIFGGSVPRQYIPAVEKGVRETMAEGVLAGYRVVDVRVTLYDGSYHSVDSSEMAFKIAASMAFKKGFMDAKPILLEPIMKIEITVPDTYMGDVMGDMNKKRGKILGMEPKGGLQIIRALAPLSEMFRYAIDLRSMTQGRGSFSMEFDHYEEVPANVAQQIIAAANSERKEA